MAIDPRDLEAAKSRFDWLREVPGLALHARTSGGEYHGPCPRCGGADRFVVWPRHPEGGHAFCRQCHPETMDPIAFLQWRDGGGFREACRRLGLPDAPLAVVPAAPKPPKARAYATPTLVDTTDFEDGHGVAQLRKERYEPGFPGKDGTARDKSFRLYHPDPAAPGGWAPGKPPGRALLLYDLRRLLAAPDGSTVYLCEGETKAKALAAGGLLATTTWEGGSAWHAPYADAFARQHVVILEDHDATGAARTARLLPSLTAVAASVRVLRFPELPEGGDVLDWLGQGHTLAELAAWAATTPPEPVAPAAPATPAGPGRFHFLDLAALAALPPPTWLIDQLLVAGGLGCLYGPSGVGKSFFALDWALSVAAGAAWDGRAVAGGPVVYLAAEGAGGLHARVAAWQSAHPEAVLRDFWLLPEAVNLIEDGLPAALVADLPSPRPALIVVDTLARSMIGGDENTARDMGLMIAAADALRRATGATVLLVHHTGKQGDAERGSSALRAACDTMIGLAPGDDDGRLVLECNKQKDAEPFARSTWARVTVAAAGSCVLQRAADVPDAGDTLRERARLVLEALCEPVFQHGAGLADLRNATDLPNWAIFRALNELIKAHAAVESGIRRTPTHRYKATAAGYRRLDQVPPWERALERAAVTAIDSEERPAQAPIDAPVQGVTAAGSTASDTPPPPVQAWMDGSDSGLAGDEQSSNTPAPGVTSTNGGLEPVSASHSGSAPEPADPDDAGAIGWHIPPPVVLPRPAPPDPDAPQWDTPPDGAPPRPVRVCLLGHSQVSVAWDAGSARWRCRSCWELHRE